MEIKMTDEKSLLLLATAADEHDEVDQFREIALQDVMAQKRY